MNNNRGFVIVAQNTPDINYVLCAAVLARSIKRVMPKESVTLLTDKAGREFITECKDFDTVIELEPSSVPYEADPYRIMHDVQAYTLSPYEHTIKLEADIFVPCDIAWWFDVLHDRDLCVATTIRDYDNSISKSRFYRKVFDTNNLPDTYNAITYFRKSATAKQFFDTVVSVFNNYYELCNVYALNTAVPPATDEVYAIAAELIGTEHVIMPNFTEMSMIHMKSMITGLVLEEWPNQVTIEVTDDNLKIDTIPQLYPFHYQYKPLAERLLLELHTTNIPWK